MNRVTTSAMAGEVTGHAGGVASPSLGHLRAAQAWWSFIALSSPLSAIMQSSDGRLLFLTLCYLSPTPHPTLVQHAAAHPTMATRSTSLVHPSSLSALQSTRHLLCLATATRWCVITVAMCETCSNSGCNYCLRTVVSASLSHNQLFTCHVTVRNLKTSGRHCNC